MKHSIQILSITNYLLKLLRQSVIRLTGGLASDQIYGDIQDVNITNGVSLTLANSTVFRLIYTFGNGL